MYQNLNVSDRKLYLKIPGTEHFEI